METVKETHSTHEVLKKENNKEATDKMFRGLKAESKVGMNYFKVKMTRVCYISNWRD